MSKKGQPAGRQGFTLIELLITISIITLLMLIGIVSYATLSKNARDGQRRTDLKTIQSGLEQYYRDQGFYPASSLTFGSGNSLTNTTGNPNSVPGAKTYINNMPGEVVNSATYQYSYSPTKADLTSSCTNNGVSNFCTHYCLYAYLENPPSPLPSAPVGCSYSSYNIVVSSP